MKPSDNCRNLIKAYEACRLTPYKDTSLIWTVGWGHVLTTPAGKQISVPNFGEEQAKKLAAEAMQRTFGKQILTQADADAQFDKDIAKAVDFVSTHITPDTTQAQFDGMVCFAFNIGIGGYLESSVRRLHNAGSRKVGTISMSELAGSSKAHGPTDTIPHAFVAWAYDNGKWMLGLFRRRLSELLVYSGWEAGKAYQTAQSFTG